MPLTRRQSRERSRERSQEREEWITCGSKSRPGRQYLFNKNTGETKWMPYPARGPNRSRGPAGDGANVEAADETALTSAETLATPPPKLPIATRNPAQERLKRLQSTLKRDRKDRTNNKQSIIITKTTTSSKNLAVKEERPSSSGLHIKESPSKRWAGGWTTKPLAATETILSTEAPIAAAPIATAPPIAIEPPTATEAPIATCSTSITKTSPTSSRSPKYLARKRRGQPPSKSPPKVRTKRASVPNTTDENVEEAGELLTSLTATSTPSAAVTSHSGNGIVHRIREICKNTYRNAAKTLESSIKRTTNFKIPKKSSADVLSASQPGGSAVKCTEMRATEQRDNDQMLAASSNAAKTTPRSAELPKTVQMTTPPPLSNTPKNLVIPSCVLGSANSRLARLRKSLLQQPSTSAMAAATPYAIPAPSVGPGTSSRNESPQNSVYQSASSSTNEEIEPMDWQPIEENHRDTVEVNDSNTTLGSINVKREHTADSTVSEYYDMVNKNLMRYDAEKQLTTHASPNKWRRDHYYFVIDTNVMLRNLTFIDDLSKMKLCDTRGTILYIPYTVLQELDKLKIRAASEGVKTLTVRAIKYLNLKFETKNKNIQAQSATDERVRLIDITSADDSIINCCLQVQKHVDHLILLTEDVNLRNKAICNNLLVSTKSDLVSNHADNDAVSPQ